MKKAAAAKPAENGDPALFNGTRSGEGDVAPATDATTDPKAAAALETKAILLCLMERVVAKVTLNQRQHQLLIR